MTRYREVGLLAEGGMALIAQAQRDDGSTVVIKRVRPPYCFDPSFLRLFHDEGAVHAALDHENIVRLLDRGEDEAGPYLVFEHVDGTDLGVVFDTCCCKGPDGSAARGLDVECVLAVAIPLFKGLASAHEARDPQGQPLHVVHRDVSPGNVLVAADGDVKLADFGVASFALKSEATVAGEMKGKFAYMAPEQTRGEKVGPRADLFSAGIVLWECLAGRRLFDGPTDADVVAAVRTQTAPALDDVRPGLPRGLVTLVAELLEKDPERRPASARDVIARLDAMALELGLDEGLRRHAGRLARLAPRREVRVREIDQRRRTQRVMGAGGTNPGVVVVRPRSTSLAPVAMAAGIVAVLAVGGVLAATLGREAPRSGDVVKLPDAPPPPPAEPKVEPQKPEPVKAEPPKAEPQGPEPQKPEPPKAARTEPPKPAPPKAPLDDGGKPAATGFGQLSITSEPWAKVTVDGNVVARETPLKKLSLPAGPHTVVLENPVYGSRTLELEVPAGGEVKRFVDLTR